MLKFWKKKVTPAEPEIAAALLDVQAPRIVDAVAAAAVAEVGPALAEHDTQAIAGAAAAPAELAAKRNWRERLSGSGLARSLGGLFARNPKLDEDLLEELETCLITADVGIAKTTTIGKLARKFQSEGRSLLLAAGDTFRAAAVEQLKTWGERNQVPVIAQGSGADSASVIFDALQTARSRGTDVLIADTAGRLHTQVGLMDELGKIRRVLGKIDAQAPHEVLMVIDGTTGQNAVNQVRQFRASIGVSGLVVTKLDGTAKGGVLFALAREFGLPIRYVGLGEGIDDLRVFNAEAFVDGLLPSMLGGNS
ncbi:MAG: signal recognition particle-docking protein FtsY [Dokdonella sp.]